MFTYASETFDTFVLDLSNLAFSVSISLHNTSIEDDTYDSECGSVGLLVIPRYKCLRDFEFGL